jgi:hypothetical protein
MIRDLLSDKYLQAYTGGTLAILFCFWWVLK